MTEIDPGPAVRSLGAGHPVGEARRWLAAVSILSAVLFGILTAVVANSRRLAVDLPVSLWVQGFNWGPVQLTMQFSNWVGTGVRGLILAGVIAILVATRDRRAALLLALGSVASLMDSVVKVSMARHRPSADLVKILDPTGYAGYSFPSGHAVFFTWLSFMLAAGIAPRVPARRRWLVWMVASAVVVNACLGRIWGGDHWLTDVVGGFLLGLSWAAFVLWVPERFLPSPAWLRGLRPAR